MQDRVMGACLDTMIPKEVLEAIKKIVALGKEAIVKKERGCWVVIENNRRVVYKDL